eukprot:TRINITY_DN62645_c0_g1_i1.p1 TRINITY_DN62645_c0_g1~~TRINITY_DN62645_c0_g1_i1.p1  ORF type:complete len:429 (-),score=57.32 TRINITY_DN62645_c0_g1_i1:40-1245(-)
MAALVALLDFKIEFLSYIDGTSLVRLCTSCVGMSKPCSSDSLWYNLVLQGWGWLVRIVPAPHTWKWLYVRLATRSASHFCVVGGAPQGILPSGGFARAFTLSTSPGVWSNLPPLREERNMAAVVRDGRGGLVVAGGLFADDQMRSLKSVEKFCPEIGVWTAMPDMDVGRSCCSASLDLRGRIFVAGGGENMYRHSPVWHTTEWFDESALASEAEAGAHESAAGPSTTSGAWRFGPPMREGRCALGVACSYATDHLYVAGGYGGGSMYHETAERLDLSSGSAGVWEMLPPMSCKRAGPNAAVGPDHRIYVVGGGPDGLLEHDTMEALDPRENRWDTSLARLRYGRHYNAAAFGPDGCLYVAGTFRHTGQLDVVERYDPRADRWEGLPRIGVPIQFCAGTFVF